MERRIKARSLLLMGLCILGFIILISRILWYQVINDEFWMDKARQTWSTETALKAKRGTILDRNGVILAVDIPAYTVVVNPKLIQQLKADATIREQGIDIEREIVSGLSELLHKSESELYKLVSAQNKKGSYYEQREVRIEGYKIDQALGDRVKALASELGKKTGKREVGIYLIDEVKRFYPKGRLASHVLGYINMEGKAVSGVEEFYDSELHGTDGWLQYDKDRTGVKLPSSTEVYRPKLDGKDIYLTIDARIQTIIMESMRAAYQKYRPQSMTTIAMDPHTGDVLGMANMPDYDPNRYWETSDMGAFYNHAIKSNYEPGSTFKIITLAAAVQEGIFQPEDRFLSGKITAGGETIKDINPEGWGTITYLEGLKRSSNVAFVKLGGDKLSTYIHQFGYGQGTGNQLPGELVKPIVYQYPADYAAASYGHGKVWITPIQQAAGISAVANGGRLMKTNLLHQMTDPSNKGVNHVPPVVVRDVTSQKTAAQVGHYLEQVVSDQKLGTGKHAYIEGYRIAGKTGTTIKASEGRYEGDKDMFSFIGYAPVDEPKLLLYTIIDNPQHTEGEGSRITSLMFREMMLKSLQYLRIAPELSQQPHELQTAVPSLADKKQQTASIHIQIPVKPSRSSNWIVPSLTSKGVEPAIKELNKLGANTQVLGVGSSIVSQHPQSGESYKGDTIYLLTEQAADIRLPTMKGKSLRDVLQVCSVLDYQCKMEGEGYVVSQTEQSKDSGRNASFVLEPRGIQSKMPLSR
ncbi:stage V sporulation protein D [Paenibacillus sp. ACRRX]|uniref:penicillin-binding transpeptidase domain-containing protein n=1 Tax=Paenibacillus sp. ACRRX TaxID=2918206 RepID=UPI001EF59766|nr:penicillin-binding transpeptidase domain-containing protein [Paenibacillus sp. ACRRX]MCG7409208.1 stage V sporulation protein D [Paenibacillus sp. ACRRX]